jgi:hypothetical protein
VRLPNPANITIGISVFIGLAVIVILILAFAHAGALQATPDLSKRCFETFGTAQWPKWIGCAMAAHESLAAGLVGAAGALFAAWLAYSAVQRQLAQQRRATTLNIATREEDRIERLLPGLERATRFLLILSTELRALTHLENSVDTLKLNGLIRPDSSMEKDVEELLPRTAQIIRDRIIAALNLLHFRAAQMVAAHNELQEAQLKVVTIAEWDPTEHAAIRAAPAAIRDKIADAEGWLRDAISELDDLERELREQARSYRGRLNELRRQIDEVLDGEDTGGARQ